MTWSPVPVYPAGESPGGMDPNPPPVVLDMEAGQVRLYAQNVRLSEILHSVATETGIIIVLDLSADRLVSFDIGPIPLDGLLRIMLRELNYAGLWKRPPDSENRGEAVLTKLFIYPKGKTAMGEEILILAGNPIDGRIDENRGDPTAGKTSPLKSEKIAFERSNGLTGALIQKRKLMAYLEKKRQVKKGKIIPASISTPGTDKSRTFEAFMAKIKGQKGIDYSGKLTNGKLILP